MGILPAVFFFLRGFLFSRSALAAENLALRQQVAVYKQSVKRPKLRPRDRVFWVWLFSPPFTKVALPDSIRSKPSRSDTGNLRSAR